MTPKLTESSVRRLRIKGRKPKKGSKAKKGPLTFPPKWSRKERSKLQAQLYFRTHFGEDTPKVRKHAVERLKKWKMLQNVAIPDSGADISIMRGDVWTTTEIPGNPQYVDVSAYDSAGTIRRLKNGKSTVLNPDGSPLCIIKLHSAAHVPGKGDTLLSQSQMEYHGCHHDDNGLMTISHSHWPFPIHCLPRGTGWFMPLRKPTKKDLETLHIVTLTGPGFNPDDFLRKQIERLLDGPLSPDNPISEGKQSDLKVRQNKATNQKASGQKRKKGSMVSEVLKEKIATGNYIPTGPQRESRESKIEALAMWCKIFGDVPARTMTKTLKANTAEAVELECEHRIIPRGTFKKRFPYLRPKFLGEKVFTDTIQWKDGHGKTKYAQTFYNKDSRYAYFAEMNNLRKHSIVQVFKEFVTNVGAPSYFIFDSFASHISDHVKEYCATLHIKCTTTEAEKQHQNKDERLNGILKSKAKIMLHKFDVDPHYTGYLYRFICHLLNLTALDCLAGRTPYEILTGETGDISHLRFHFWEPVWFMRKGSKFPNPDMVMGRYLGPCENTGDKVTHYVLPVNGKGKVMMESLLEPDPKQSGQKKRVNRRYPVLGRSYVCARDPTEKAWRQVITDHRRSFLFPRSLCPARYNREMKPWRIQVLEDHISKDYKDLIDEGTLTKKDLQNITIMKTGENLTESDKDNRNRQNRNTQDPDPTPSEKNRSKRRKCKARKTQEQEPEIADVEDTDIVLYEPPVEDEPGLFISDKDPDENKGSVSEEDKLIEAAEQFKLELSSAEARAHPDALLDFTIFKYEYKKHSQEIIFYSRYNPTGRVEQ